MKRLVALFVAVMLVLSCTLAFADEEAKEAEQPVGEEAVVTEEEETEEAEPKEAEPEEETAEAAADEWWNVLLMGGDSRSTEDYERTDSVILFSVNKNEPQIKLASIMRDTLVDLSDYGSKRLNTANVLSGPELTVQAVNEHYGTDIKDYILINMTDMIDIIDMLGGVDLEISEDELKWINYYAKMYETETKKYEGGDDRLAESGNVHLNGLLAMSHTRNRYSDSDFGRVVRQRNVLLAMAQKIQDTDFDELLSMGGEIASRVQTNMSGDEVEELITGSLSAEIDDVQQMSIPAEGTYTVTKSGLLKPDFEENSRLLKEFIYG